MPDKKNIFEEAWAKLNDSIVEYNGKPIGTKAASDNTHQTLNYDQIFTRDFAVSAIAFLMKGEYEIVKNFLLETADLQSKEKQFDCFKPGEGLMPASFRVDSKNGKDKIIPDYGEKAIARVAPVDSGFWWIFILRAYVKITDDWDFAHSSKIQKSITLILELSMVNRFDMFPTLLVPDGSFMIDRRLGVYGYPFDIQSLFYSALRSSKELLKSNEENKKYIDAVVERLGNLAYHLQKYYWLDFNKLNEIYRYQVEEYSETAINQFNIYPQTIPKWIYNWLDYDNGYFVGNVGPSRLDFRFFSAGNLMAILSGLADKNESELIMNLFQNHWDYLIGHMPLKLCYPALKGEDWRKLTGHDAKNIAWSYHNGGSWPSLLWVFSAAASKVGKVELIDKAISIAEKRLQKDGWPEYYDGIENRLIGKEARTNQTWSIAGYLIAKMIQEKPERVDLVNFEEDSEVIKCTKKVTKKLNNKS